MNVDAKQQEDRSEITQLIYRYANRMDDLDMDGVMECFAPDAIAEFGGGAFIMRGHDEIKRVLGEAAHGGNRDATPPTTHLMTNVLVELAGDRARAETTAVAYRTHVPGKIIVRGLRYSDECVRSPNGWVFASRRHKQIWEFTVPGELTPPFERPGT